VLTAWSTPGAALLVSAGVGVPMDQAVGAFIVCALLIVLSGITGWFARIMDRIPQALAAALLAGVLARFAVDAFLSLRSQPTLVLTMFAVYLLGRRWWPRYAVPAVLLAGVSVAALQGQLHLGAVQWQWATPVFTAPGLQRGGDDQHRLALVRRDDGVAEPAGRGRAARRRLSDAGVAGHHDDGPGNPAAGAVRRYALNLAAITAAICMGREAHEDPSRRWTASAAAGVFYIAVGLLGGAVVGLIAAFPKELVLALAGFALLGTIGSGLAVAMKDEHQREAALITFLVTTSGLVLWGVGSAFWGVVAGALTLLLLRRR
jgi:benzoate membrane transport protein